MKKLFIIFVLFIIFLQIIDEPDFGENYKSVSWLPKEATNISFNQNRLQKAYEFKISEKGFFEWLNKMNNHNAPLITFNPTDHNSSDSIYRYNMSVENEDNKTVQIVDGYFCTYRTRNGGGYWIGYDRQSKKAYYFGSSH